MKFVPRFYRANFANETDANVFVYRAYEWIFKLEFYRSYNGVPNFGIPTVGLGSAGKPGFCARQILIIGPRESVLFESESGGQAFVASTSEKYPLKCQRATEDSPNHYCLEMRGDDECGWRHTTPPLQVRILSPPERTLERLCLESVAYAVTKGHVTAPSSNVDELCLPRQLKDDLRFLVQNPSDYARAQHFIQNAEMWC